MQRGRLIDQGRYDAMLAAFREKPGNARQCSLTTGVDHRTAMRAWREGWPERGLRPIRLLVEEEQAGVRAELQRAREEELRKSAQSEAQAASENRADAQKDAMRSRREEAQMVRAARHNAMGLMAAVQRLLKGANKLAEDVEATLEKQRTGGEAPTLTVGKATALFHQIASTARAANESAKLSQQMERSLLGEPEKWVGLQVEGMTRDEAYHEIELAARAIQRAREQGIVVEGHELPPPPEEDERPQHTSAENAKAADVPPSEPSGEEAQQQAEGAEADGAGAGGGASAPEPSREGQRPPAPPSAVAPPAGVSPPPLASPSNN